MYRTIDPKSRAGIIPIAQATIAGAFVLELVDLAVLRGASREALAERVGEEMLRCAPEGRVPYATYVALMRASIELCGDTAFALHCGEATELAELSLVGAIGRASASMADAFRSLNRLSSLIVNVPSTGAEGRFQLARRDGDVWVVDTREKPNQFPELTEVTFARMVCTARRWFGNSSFLRAVHVSHASPRHLAEYARVFRAPIVFDSDVNALVTDDAWLSKSTDHASPYVTSVLTKNAEAQLRVLGRAESLRGRVEMLLLPLLQTRAANIHSVANSLCISRQTLFRHLKAEGVTFEGVLGQLRYRLALQYLRGGKTTVRQTAELLGFSEPAAFSRAFKRWSGLTPREASGN